MLAKGARRQKSGVRGLILPFHPLLLSWAGKGHLPILTAAEPGGIPRYLLPKSISSAYYVNELILKFLHRFDEHAELYDHYDDAIRKLSSGFEIGTVLRIFEKRLLQEIGFGLILDHDVETGEEVNAGFEYQYLPQKGPILVTDTDNSQESSVRINGGTLNALLVEQFDSQQSKRQARSLLRHLIYQQLGGKELRSRRVMMQLLQYQKKNDN